MAAITESRGAVRAVTDDEILDAYKWLPANEGVFCEPASAASVAGLLKHGVSDAARAGAEGGRPKVVCVLTGNGLKDPDTAFDNVGSVIPCEPEMSALESAVLG
jgi:threonine synthase